MSMSGTDSGKRERAATDGPAIGRRAPTQAAIPPRGWLQILKRVVQRTSNENLPLIAAGVAFYGLLALFPAVAALISLYGLVADPAQVQAQFQQLQALLPAEVSKPINQQMRNVADSPQQGLGLGIAGGLLLSLWGATRGTKAVISALNISYGEHDQRGFIALNLFALGMTLFVITVFDHRPRHGPQRRAPGSSRARRTAGPQDVIPRDPLRKRGVR